jgi:hypothetical protein
MRAVGRMGFFRHFKEIYAQLERMVGEVMSSTNRNALLSQKYEVPADRAPIIYIVFSLCGGTGSSLFFDVAYILRKLFASKNIKPTIVALAMLPGPYIRHMNSLPQKERIQANTYAALQELERLHNLALGQGQRHNRGAIWDVEYPNNVHAVSYDLPFDYIYLLDDTAKHGLQYTREQICELVGHALFWLSGPPTAIHFWERAKNLVSNNLASGGSMDIAGCKRLPKYSSLGISTVALDWNIPGLQRAFESIVLETIKDIKPAQLELPQWLENAGQMILIIGQPFAPPQLKLSGVFRSGADVERALNTARTEYSARTNLANNSRWLARRKGYAENALKEIALAIHGGLRKRGPVAVCREVELLLTNLQEMKSALRAEETQAYANEQQAEQKFNEILQVVAPQAPFRDLALRFVNFLLALSGGWGNGGKERHWKRVAENAQRQLHSCYELHFRGQVCRELRDHVLEPAIQFLEQWRGDLEEAKEIMQRWLRTNEEELKREEQRRTLRAQALFEPVIWIAPMQTDSLQVMQAIDRDYGNVRSLAEEILNETFRSGLQVGSSITRDLKKAIIVQCAGRLSLFTGRERVLERLVGRGAEIQRDQFWLRTECFWSYRQDATQGAAANLEAINLLGVGEDTDNDLTAKMQMQSLLGTHGERTDIVPTGFGNELVYVKTSHGLPITLIHGMEELHQAYLQMSVIRNATYLHLDNREEVLSGYTQLVHTDLTYRDFIEEWEGVARDIDRVDKLLAGYIKIPLQSCKVWFTQQGKIDHQIQIVEQKDASDPLDLLLQFVDNIEGGLVVYRPQKTMVTIPAYMALANLKGFLKVRGWTKTPGNIWVHQQ